MSMKFKNKQEVHDYLKNSKVDAGSRFVEVLKVLHKYSFTLYSLTNVHKIIPEWYIEYRFLFINNKSIVGSISTDVFNHSHFKELSVEDILSIEIEKEVVQSHGFKPFDKVLMCKNDSCWNPEFFKCYGYDGIKGNVVGYMSINGCTYTHCIPFEGNEELAFKPYNHEDER